MKNKYRTVSLETDFEKDLLSSDIPYAEYPRPMLKRDSYISIVKAVEFAKKHLGVNMELGKIKCTHWAQNNQCIGERCPFK